MLEVAGLHAYYGKSHILHGVSLNVGAGEIVSLLGRNGVGRSTTIKAVMGQVSATGSVRFKGQEILGRKTFEIAHLGLGYPDRGAKPHPRHERQQTGQVEPGGNVQAVPAPA
jgi:branched-chain amino acid transport system ATP-binding protein